MKEQSRHRNLNSVSNKILAAVLSKQQDLFTNFKVVQDLIYNEPTKLVSQFKDYLIYDDINEFMKRPYTKD